MGGKDKKAPRTKGNLKPSSSSRSADLLGHAPQFVGFGGLSDAAYVPVMNAGVMFSSEEVELSIPAEFRLTLRKMGKKDVTTKIKALQEFVDLCEQMSEDVLTSVLPFWPRIFSRLAVDGDRRVRENLHKSHKAFAAKLGRNIAPCLKEIMGVWFTSQCDPYAPASSVASDSLKCCFPEGKLRDAIAYCHKEIVDYISECLFKDEDYSEEQRERVLIGGMAGYSLLLQDIDIAKILSNKSYLAQHINFWTLEKKLYKVVLKNSSPAIKQAFFTMIYSWLHFLPSEAQGSSEQLVSCLSTFLDDDESLAIPALWEAVLKLLLVKETVPNYVAFASRLAPKVKKVLETACFGNASKMCSFIVSLAKVLRDCSQEKEKLDRQVVDAFCLGLASRSVANSPMEAAALSTGLFQFVDFIISTTKDAHFVRDIVQNSVIPALDNMFKSQCNDVVLVAVVRQMALKICDWFNSTDDQPIASAVWSELEQFILNSTIRQLSHPDHAAVHRVGVAVATLLDPNAKVERGRKPASRAVCRIRFADSTSEEVSGEAAASALPPNASPSPKQHNYSELFRKKAVQLCARICQKALDCVESNGCQCCLNLVVLLTRYDEVSHSLLLRSDESTSPTEVIARQILPLLGKFPDVNTASMLFLNALDVVERDYRLKFLEEVIQDETVGVALAITALEELWFKESVREWLCGPQVAKLLKSAAEQLVTFTCDRNARSSLWNLVRASLLPNKSKPSHKGKMLPEGHLNVILDAFTEHMTGESILVTDSMNQFIKEVAEIWKLTPDPIHRLESSAKWLDSLISLFCSNKANHLEPDATERLLEMWSHGVSFAILSTSACQSAITIIKKTLLLNPPDEGMVERIVDAFQRIVSLMDGDVEALRLIVQQRLLLTAGEWKNLANEANAPHLMAKEFVIGKCSYMELPATIASFKPVQVNSWSGMIKAAFFMSSVVHRNPLLFHREHLIFILPYLLYAAEVANLLLGLFARQLKDPCLKGIERLKLEMESILQALLSGCSTEEHSNLIMETKRFSSERQWVWSNVHQKLQSQLLEDAALTNALQSACQEFPLHSVEEGKQNTVLQDAQLARLRSLTSDEWASSRQPLAAIRLGINRLASSASRAQTGDTVVSLVQVLQTWHSEHNEEFLFSTDLKKEDGTVAAWTVLEIIHLLSSLVEFYPGELTRSSWDFILCSMSSWCGTLEESWNLSASSPVQSHKPLLLSFTVALCCLIRNCANLLTDMERSKSNDTSLPTNLKTEWNDVFAEVAYRTVIPLFARLSKQSRSQVQIQVFDYFLEVLSLSFSHVPYQHIQLTVDQLCPLLLSKPSPVQFAAYGLVARLLPSIVSTEVSTIQDGEDSNQVERRPPQAMLLILEKTCLTSIEETRVGDLCVIEPYSSECTQLLAFCLTWELLLQLCGHSNSELRYMYAAFLSNSGLVSKLMETLFCIIPHATQQTSVDLDLEFLPNFTITEQSIQALATRIYSSALRFLPAVVRRWCNNTDKRTASLVERFTARCVSPALCALDLQFCTKTWDNMIVRVRPSVREVIATYKLNEEGSMELVIQLPSNYPLGNINVETGRKVGVTSSQWRNWMLQLTTFLTHQNGSILDGLTLWKRNVDKRFEGIEECYICYYVLHGSNYQLPTLQCRTCRKKFHADCLYKWFSTSNNSTCPLCRNLF